MGSKRRGIALIELIAAAVIFGLATMAAFQAWRLCFKLSSQGREQAVASQIARSEVEMSKIQGFENLPIGTLIEGSSPAAGKWSESAKYFDEDGNSLASSADAKLRYYSSERWGFDDGVLKSTTTASSYVMATTTMRSVVVKVVRIADQQEMVRMGIHFTKGGL